MDDYLNVNRKSWNARVDAHMKSDFYDLESFKNGKSSLNEIELQLLGDISNKSILHLQCHFGQDSISLARLGAKVTAVDFSDEAIEQAKILAKMEQVDITFICSDVYKLADVLHDEFDIVFTSYGTIAWLPDLDKWATTIKHFLKPTSKFIFAEFHPALWMYDDHFSKLSYHYFNRKPYTEMEEGSYAENDSKISFKSIFWNHSLSEVISALSRVNMRLDDFQEYDYSPYPCIPGMKLKKENQWVIEKVEIDFPLVYSLVYSNLS